MSKAKMLAAKEAIQAKDYGKARAILETVDHPTARAWLGKLPAAKAPVKRRSRRRMWLAVAVAVLVLAAGAVWLFYVQPNLYRIEVRTRAFGYCLDISPDVSSCSAWSDSVAASVRYATIAACHQQSPELDAPFNDCMIAENILPPGVSRR